MENRTAPRCVTPRCVIPRCVTTYRIRSVVFLLAATVAVILANPQRIDAQQAVPDSARNSESSAKKDQALRPISRRAETPTPATTRQPADAIVSVPASGADRLLSDTGINGSLLSGSRFARQLKEIDRDMRELEARHAPGINSAVLGGDRLEKTSRTSAVKRQKPALQAVLSSPSLLGARLPVAGSTLKPGRDSEVFCDVECSLGDSLAAVGLHQDGETLLLRAYRIMIAAKGVHHARTQRVIKSLTRLYDSWSNTVPAKKRAAQHYRSLLAR